MNYRSELTSAMRALAADPLRIFLGYGVTTSHALGTLRDVPRAQLLEMPVAENLMAGVGCGMALAGLKPVVYFERFDFVLNAADAIVNHIGKLGLISRGQFVPHVIIRVTVGNRQKPLFTGLTHTQDFSEAFALMCDFPVVQLTKPEHIASAYADASTRPGPTMLVEYKDLL